MSYTTIKAVWPGERHEDLEELSNSHGSAPVIWSAMCSKYLGTGPAGYLFSCEKLWPLYKRRDIPPHQRAALLLTYDRCYILRAHYKRAAADLRAFLEDFPQNENRVNHWPRIIEILESDPDIPAIGFHMTSVSEDLFCGEWDDEKEEYQQPDWSRFWSVYDEFDELERSAQDGTKGPNA